MTTLIISSEEINDTMKIVKSLEESCVLTKVVRKTIKNEAKKGGISRNVLRHFRWFIRGPLPTGKGTIRADEVTFRADEGTIGAVQYFEWCLVLQQILKLKSIIKINLGNYLTKKKDGAY